MLTGASWPAFVCPLCRKSVARVSEAWRCDVCNRVFPEVDGIADFRVEPDPWIGLEEDRDKATRLLARTPGASFEQTVREYWAMTPSTPAWQAERHIAAVLGAERRTHDWLEQPGNAMLAAPAARSAPLIDLGCGTGELLAILAEREVPAIGIDVAMRWLVQARRRPALAAGHQLLVCCNAERLPFADGVLGAAVGLGLLEHCAAPKPVLAEAHRVLQRGSPLRLRTVNRFGLLPEPHVGVWGVGFVPRNWADRYVHWRSGERYLHHRPISAGELRRALQAAGFHATNVTAASLLSSDVERLAPGLRPLAPTYAAARRVPIARRALSAFAPLVEATGVA